MSFYLIYPFFLIMAVLLAMANTPLFSAADTPPIPKTPRFDTLDGLRGFLALSVFFHHGAIYHGFILNGGWDVPPSRFYTLLGQIGVSLFFMITGFLFWMKLIRTQGRPDLVPLYLGRIFRIGPLYGLAVAAMFAFVLVETGPHLHVSPLHLMGQIVRWSFFGIFIGSGLNGVEQAGLYLAYVTWSLQFEWMFYISLIFSRYFCRVAMLHFLPPALLLVLSLPLLYVVGPNDRNVRAIAAVALFGTGMLVASIRSVYANVDARSHAISGIVILLLALIMFFCKTAYGLLAIIIMAPVFFLIANGATIFGLLTSRPARRLGDISFGIYLLQGLVLAAAFGLRPVRDLAAHDAAIHWIILFFAAIALISAAVLSHVYIERRGVRLGREIVDRLRRRAAGVRGALASNPQ